MRLAKCNSTAELECLGQRVAEIFMLRKCRGFGDRYETNIGSKTALGLGRMLQFILNEYERGIHPERIYR